MLDPTAADSGVKLAQAETHALQTLQNALAQAGVNFEALSATGPRSETTLVLRNLPSTYTTSAVADLLSPHGSVGSIVSPAGSGFAVVDMVEPQAASDVLRKMTYQKIGNAMLLISRPASNVWSERRSKAESMASSPVNTTPQDFPGTTAQVSASGGDEKTLFVKNLPFTATTAVLAALCQQQPGYVFAKVQAKSPTLSAGYGFVGFATAAHAAAAATALQGKLLSGRPLVVSTSNTEAKAVESNHSSSKASGTLLVKNLPFEASKQDVQTLFGYAYSLMTPCSTDCMPQQTSWHGQVGQDAAKS